MHARRPRWRGTAYTRELVTAVSHRRALLLADPRARPDAALSALRRVAPALERVVVVGKLRALGALWSSDTSREPAPEELHALDAWRAAAAGVAPSTEARHAPELPVEAIVDLALTEDADILVGGARSLESVSLLTDAGRRLRVPVLLPAGEARDAPIRRVFCAAIGRRALASLVAFAREHAGPSLVLAVLGPAAMAPEDLAASLRVLGIEARVELLPRSALSPRAALAAAARGGAVDLVVLARAPAALLLGYPWPAPVLVVPPVTLGPRPPAFDLTDVVELDGARRALVAEVTAIGSLAPAADWTLAFVSEGLALGTAITSPAGELEVPAAIAGTWLGAVRVLQDEAPDALAALEQRFTVLRPGERSLVLFDPEMPDGSLQALRELARGAGVEPLAVRLRPVRPASAIRRRLEAAGLPSHVIDARAVLAEGDAHDVAEANDPVRLRRVAARMRAAGFPVASVLHRGLEHPEPPADEPACTIEGNRVEVELDNARARGWLLDAIAQSRRSVNLQVYMAADDDVGRAVEAALADAGARGVTVRALVDSLHGMHGSFGAENPLLARLAARPGVELRVGRPLTGVPTSLADIKQRDHRKIVVVDDAIALVGGRNLSHEYYTAFEEAGLAATTTWRQVPWLDAGARIEGPAVAAISASFVEAWIEAGGAPFDVERPAPAGSTPARVVVHRGLRDAHTLEAYLELVERARSHVVAVNGFPYVLELQHALLRALRRGVRVRAVTGHLTPTHDGVPFAGAWSSARSTATEFVHSRLDPIVDAGGEVYLLAQLDVPGWERGLGPVYPHVHAKLMSADGLRCAVGSANLDVTSSYWESELMIVVEDAAIAGPLERRIDQLVAASSRVDREDPAWRERARRRSWMRRWPGVLSI